MNGRATKIEISPSGTRYIVPDDYGRSAGGQIKLTQDCADAIASAVRAGAKPRRAAVLAGLDQSTWTRCRQRAKRGEEPYATRVAEIYAAEAACLAEAEARIVMAGLGGEWQADRWLLETRDRATYGRRTETTIKRDSRDVTTISMAELLQIAAGDE